MIADRYRRRSRRMALVNALVVGFVLIIIAACGSPSNGAAPTPTVGSSPPLATPTVAAAPTLVSSPVAASEFPALTAKKSLVQHQPKDQDAAEVPLGIAQQLVKGDRVNVDQQGRAELRFADALLVEVFRDSKLTITGASDPNASALEAYLLEGGLALNRFELDQIAQKRVRIETEWAEIDDLGTDFFTYYDQNTHTTWVVVLKGQVEVNAPRANAPQADKMVRVSAGMQTWVEPQQPPEPPIPAERAAVGGRFPLLQDLTDGEYRDEDVLPTLTGIALDRTTIIGGAAVQGTITLNGNALEGGAQVTLTNSNPSAAAAPPNVIVPPGAIDATFTVTTRAVSQETTVDLIAAYGSTQQKITLTIQPPLPPAPTLTPTPSPTLRPTVRPTLTPTPSPTPTSTLTPTPSPRPNDIRNFKAAEISPSELSVVVDYTYTGDQGSDNIFMAAYARLDNGRQVPGTGFRPARLAVGDGQATVNIGAVSGSSGTYDSTAVEVCMYVGGQPEFYCQTYGYVKQWALSANSIRNFRATEVSEVELNVEADYTYTGDQGSDNIFMAAYALQENGQQVPGTGYRPARVSVGDGQATVNISVVSGSGLYASTSVRVCMYVGGQAQFHCETFPHTKTWGIRGPN